MQLDENRRQTICERLHAAVISDVLDQLGHRDQAMASFVRPLDEASIVFGRARTGLYRDVYHVPTDHNPYALELALIDDLKPGDVAILACGASGRITPWGELLTTAGQLRGAAGCITDGAVRDVKAIKKLSFPVFHGGINPLDSQGRGEVAAIDVAVACGGVKVQSGDLVFGDADGVMVIPQSIEDEVIEAAFAKVDGEDRTRDALKEGLSLTEAFERYGIL